MKAETMLSEVQQTTSRFHSSESGLQILMGFQSEHSFNKIPTSICGEMETATVREFNWETRFIFHSVYLIAFLISLAVQKKMQIKAWKRGFSISLH